MLKLLQYVENFFDNPEVQAVESFVGKNIGGLLTILQAAGVKHTAVASAIIKDVVATSTTETSDADKLKAVTDGVIQLGSLVNSSHLQNPVIAGVVAETAYQAVKEAGALAGQGIPTQPPQPRVISTPTMAPAQAAAQVPAATVTDDTPITAFPGLPPPPLPFPGQGLLPNVSGVPMASRDPQAPTLVPKAPGNPSSPVQAGAS